MFPKRHGPSLETRKGKRIIWSKVASSRSSPPLQTPFCSPNIVKEKGTAPQNTVLPSLNIFGMGFHALASTPQPHTCHYSIHCAFHASICACIIQFAHQEETQLPPLCPRHPHAQKSHDSPSHAHCISQPPIPLSILHIRNQCINCMNVVMLVDVFHIYVSQASWPQSRDSQRKKDNMVKGGEQQVKPTAANPFLLSEYCETKGTTPLNTVLPSLNIFGVGFHALASTPQPHTCCSTLPHHILFCNHSNQTRVGQQIGTTIEGCQAKHVR